MGVLATAGTATQVDAPERLQSDPETGLLLTRITSHRRLRRWLLSWPVVPLSVLHALQRDLRESGQVPQQITIPQTAETVRVVYVEKRVRGVMLTRESCSAQVLVEETIAYD